MLPREIYIKIQTSMRRYQYSLRMGIRLGVNGLTLYVKFDLRIPRRKTPLHRLFRSIRDTDPDHLLHFSQLLFSESSTEGHPDSVTWTDTSFRSPHIWRDKASYFTGPCGLSALVH